MLLTPELLKRKRKELGLSQAEVAMGIGVTQTSYQYYEKGQRKPKIEVANKLLKVLKISETELVEAPVVKSNENLAQLAITDVLIEEVARLKADKEKRPMIEVLKELNENANSRAIQLLKHLGSS